MAKKYFSGIIKGFFAFFNRLRLFLINIIFWGFILSVLFLLFQGEIIPDINKNTVLNINLNGRIVEQYTGGYRSEFESIASGRGEILLRDIKKVIDYAASDDRISSMFLDLSGFNGSGLAKIQELAHSLDKFRDSGKEILCFSDSFDNSSYYLASRASRIILDPLGEVRLRGYGSYKSYFKKGLDKFSIKMNVFKAGDYKSAVEPYLYDEMSEYDREALSAFYKRIIDYYAEEVAKGRNKNHDDIFDYMKNYHIYLKKTGGDGAVCALDNGFIDSIADYNSAVDMIDEIEEVEWREYLKAVHESDSENKIAVITASGMILDGNFEPGKIGSETFTSLFKEVSDDPDVKAVVFRIDSGGGSASASEVIRRAVIRLKEKGKPVIVSMSSAAASGGYWISADSDMIFSYPSTVTGSIGVFAVLPDFSEFLDKYTGISIDGFSVPDSPTQYRPDVMLDEREKEIIQLSVENIYENFINIVAEGRTLDPDEVRRIAGGRIWSGLDAVENRLIDRIGYFDDAVEEAVKLSGISDYKVVYIDPADDWKTQVIRELAYFTNMVKSSSVLSFLDSVVNIPGLLFTDSINKNIFESNVIYSWTWLENGFSF